MIIEIGNPLINLLEHRVFAIPALNWNAELPQVENANGTIQALYTTWLRHGHEHLAGRLSQILEDNPINATNIENLIINPQINNYLINNDEETLLNIFHAIQLWGGKQARQFYLQNIILNLQSYSNFVQSIIEAQSIELIINHTQNIIFQTPQFDIAFATKHVSFWLNYANAPIKLPIYDSVMSKGTMGRSKTYQQFGDLHRYWQGFTEDFNILQIENPALTVMSMERQLFNFFRQNPTPSIHWPRQIL
ncbi:MAG: hypothetical protein NBV77_07055 [Bacteroidia bacterium]|nr:hypothetical protein [Bacteroidia bacterium]